MKYLILYSDREGTQQADTTEGSCSPALILNIHRTLYHVDETKPMFLIELPIDGEPVVRDTDAYLINVGAA